MARKIGNRNTKTQGGIMIVGEGMTEWYYLQSINSLISSEVRPKLREHKDGIGYIEKKIKECIDNGADKVICLIDMDNKQNEPNASEYIKFKEKYDNKDVSGKMTRNRARVELYENFPCVEMWFHYYFKLSTANISSYEEVIKRLKPHWANYDKTEKYFLSLPEGIHQYLVDTLGGDFNNALKNSKSSKQSRSEFGAGAYSEMKSFFDLILREEIKGSLPIYRENDKVK